LRFASRHVLEPRGVEVQCAAAVVFGDQLRENRVDLGTDVDRWIAQQRRGSSAVTGGRNQEEPGDVAAKKKFWIE
jgi:hypothetical protein